MESLYEFKKDSIWIKEYPINLAGIKFNSRMTIVRLLNGNLFIHSPCEIDEHTKIAIEKLGNVEFIVAPGLYHHLYVGSAQNAFPNAETFICPGVERRNPELNFDWFLGNRPDKRWEKDFEQVLIRGNKYMWEVAFYHKTSKTLILVDLIENFTEKTEGINFALKLLMKWVLQMWHNPKPAPEYQFGWKNKKSAARILKIILAWDFDKIIVSHGNMINTNAKETAIRAWRQVFIPNQDI